ncbi:nucleoside triphosphate pyrophosphatase [Amphritea sp. 1_MG-2023]|uniref:Maf family protein n=1 Tax=Amphritea sp. 1_MG-2023 TaxID=3062670 RepID=UPI0026E1B36F|nr:nucleoside triphosphate pyrophosphatase [Amphritea sp. 1_MG-2023]MDO6563111.1 nucleoside triphosphate pyrophosphatase [Amphritea sp. 1_MG-2023]
MTQLILASSSPFRKAILDKLNLDYQALSPDIDETRLTDESPAAYVARLARAKAAALQSHFPTALIIGSDQTAIINGETIGKPGHYDAAFQQLSDASGQKITFLTGLSLLNSHTGECETDVIPYHVYFRQLTASMIDNYLQAEQPYNCAGSFKSEGLGIALFEKLEGDDPNTLIGLPLIRLIRMLETQGLPII